MRVIVTVSLFCGLAALAALTGCAGQSSHVAAPDLNDPAWTPPGEMSVTVHSAPAPTTNTNTNSNAAMACQPNKREIRSHQIHAATY